MVSLPGPLSDDGARDLAAIWAELAAFGEQMEGVPLAELRDRFTEFEARILAVAREQAQAPASPDGSAATDGAAADGYRAADPSGTATPTSRGGRGQDLGAGRLQRARRGDHECVTVTDVGAGGHHVRDGGGECDGVGRPGRGLTGG